MSLCGNCNYNCCCKCLLDHCHICKRRYAGQRATHCSGYDYPTHWICLNCQIGGKKYDRFDHNKRDNGPGVKRHLVDYYDLTGIPRCRKCSQDMMSVGRNFRSPKESDDRSWIVIRKILLDSDEDLEKLGDREDVFVRIYADYCVLRYMSYSQIWRDAPYKYDWSHQMYRHKGQIRFTYPHYLREYPDFIETLRSTYMLTIFDVSVMWDMIRAYVRLSRIIHYWRRMTKINRLRRYFKAVICTDIELKPGLGIKYFEARDRFDFNLIDLLQQIQ
jgi:hypothetical protein